MTRFFLCRVVWRCVEWFRMVWRGVALCAGLFEAEHEIHCGNQAHSCYNVIPFDLHIKGYHREEDKHHQCNHLLQNLQLHEREWSAIALKANAIGRHLQAVLEERNAP